MSLKSFVSYSFLLMAGCSGGTDQNAPASQRECYAALVDACREQTPGQFKTDVRGACDAPFENEVPAAYCTPGRERQAAIRDELSLVDDELKECVADSDCVLAELTASCDFGCGFAVNIKADLTRRNELVDEFNSYTMCEAKDCKVVRTFVGPRCEKGRCASP